MRRRLESNISQPRTFLNPFHIRRPNLARSSASAATGVVRALDPVISGFPGSPIDPSREREAEIEKKRMDTVSGWHHRHPRPFQRSPLFLSLDDTDSPPLRQWRARFHELIQQDTCLRLDQLPLPVSCEVLSLIRLPRRHCIPISHLRLRLQHHRQPFHHEI